MKKIIILLALLVSAAPAQAGVKSHKADKSPDEVRAYWTAERMRDAIPIEQAKRETRAKPGSTSSWSTVTANWTALGAIGPAHGKVFFSDGTYNYVCSGTLVSSTSGS